MWSDEEYGWSEETLGAVEAAYRATAKACMAVSRDAARLTEDGDLIAAHLAAAHRISINGIGADDAASRLYRDLICGKYRTRQEMHDRLEAIMDARAEAECNAAAEAECNRV